ncbi:YEATS domain-containing protein [Martiniozyma asiatica (nom. inval.)]|nr:YEATS domain-containing protein [Martiniozyma asiatica]
MGHPSQKRIKQITIAKPILLGNTAYKFSPTNPRPPNSPPEHTHSWTIFIRDPTGNDLSQYIKRVVFKLHDTYPNSTRSIESPPFQVSETGWGEFEVIVRIYLEGEKGVSMVHHLKLHPYGPSGSATASGTSNWSNISSLKDLVPQGHEDGYVESVQYDEIVFNEPTESMFALLTKRVGSALPEDLRKREMEEMDRIAKAKEEVSSQLETLLAEFTALEEEKNLLMDA